MTPEERARLRALEAHGARGRWYYERGSVAGYGGFLLGTFNAHADAVLAAEARNALRPLLDALDGAERERAVVMEDSIQHMELALKEQARTEVAEQRAEEAEKKHALVLDMQDTSDRVCVEWRDRVEAAERRIAALRDGLEGIRDYGEREAAKVAGFLLAADDEASKEAAR